MARMRPVFTVSFIACFLNLFPLTSGQYFSNQTCRFLPSDKGWPSLEAWSQLNTTVNGRLIAVIPQASVCHEPNFDASKCEALAAGWTFPQTHWPSPSSLMAPFWQNQSCDPFTPESTPCRQGNYVDYAINVTSAADVAAGLKFAQKSNIRLVIKNTGHDYLGKSTGRGSLSIWTHNLKSIDFMNFSSPAYKGPAFKIGAGIQAFEIYDAADARGLRVVGGECATVGISGGYTQGGGHSALASTYGLGADQTLEWEVVTANGTHLIASPTQNSDIYFALSGGGGGTYGVVLSLTVRAHQDGVVSGASLKFNTTGISTETFWEGVSQFHAFLPAIVDTGATAVYFFHKISSETTFEVGPFTSPNKTKAEVATILQPLLDKLNELKMEAVVNITSFPTYVEHWEAYFGALPFGSPAINAIATTLGSRLIPRSVVENTTSNAALSATYKAITDMPEGFMVSGVAVNVSHAVAGNNPSTNAVLPAWREALIHNFVLSPWNFTAPISENNAAYGVLADTVIPALEAITPDSGAYLNEALFQQTDFQKNFYGSNYETLRGIKRKHDPEDLFYAVTAVGSEAWVVGSDGRLCRAEDW